MISPEEIKVQALKWWKSCLQSYILGEAFFPRTIDRIGKVQSGDVRQRFELLQQEIALLYRHSKNEKGIGYLVITADHNFRRTGSHELPGSVVFETAEDYLAFTGTKKQWKLFVDNYEQVIATIPLLKDWAFQNSLWLTEPAVNWINVLKVCRYFIDTPRPNLYIRQLPLEIHTKFIEENIALLQSLLNYLIPDHVRSANQKRFAERYFLRYDEPLVRMRFLDPALYVSDKLSDLSIPLSDFGSMDFGAENILIAENKMNFLTLPDALSTIALWSGGGFNISYLRNAACLNNKKIFYWGDIDEHGFQILHQLRSYYPQARSIMMDRQTFDLFRGFAVDGSRNRSEQLGLLTEDEAELYRYLKSLDGGNRLEQEKLPQGYVEEWVERALRP
ncbi:MAG: Wadjet anti-phage system protein JetD domain-containing protein [Chitinophagaceae bacterium]